MTSRKGLAQGRSRAVAGGGCRGRLACAALCACIAMLAVFAFACSSALAAFTRPFVRQITGTTSESFGGPGGVAVDGSDNLWVGDGFNPNVLDEFAPAYAVSGNEFQTALSSDTLTLPQSLAIERSTGDFVLTGNENQEGFRPHVEVLSSGGSLLEQWEKFGKFAHVAVDNSSEPLEDPSACGTSPLALGECFVYVAHAEADPESPNGDGAPVGIGKFKISSEAAAFVNAKGEPTSLPYVSGSEITGTPTGPGGCAESVFTAERLSGVAVDAQGDIYALDGQCGGASEPAIVEYRPSGEFVRTITGAGTPGIAGVHAFNGFGGTLSGIALDPLTGHLLVALQNESGSGAIDEFELPSGRYLNQIKETVEGSPLRQPGEMTVDSHSDLYVVEAGERAVEVFGPGAILPNVTAAETGARTSSSAVLRGTVNPEGLELGSCSFQYVTEEAFRENVEAHGGKESEGFADLSTGGEAVCTPGASEIPADKANHVVQATVTGLSSGVVYRYRLLASTEGASGGSAVSGSLAFTVPHAPKVEASFASDISSTFVDLNARIDPLGGDTTYYFQYVDEAAFDEHGFTGAEVTPTTDIGSGGLNGNAIATAIQHVGGLTPATTYRFRVLASNQAGSEVGPEGTFTTLAAPAAGLPDNRAYELLTPSDKGGAGDMFAHQEDEGEFLTSDVGLPSESGSGFLLDTTAAFGPFPASGENVYVFSRGAGGWSYTSLASPSLGVQSIERPVFNPEDFSQLAFDDEVGSEGSEKGVGAITLTGAPGGPYATLSSEPPEHELGGHRVATKVVAASRDVSHVLIESPVHTLAPGDGAQDPGSTALYEWSGGSLRLVNVDSGGTLLNPCGAGGGQDSTLVGSAHNSVSADGSKIIFTAPDPHMRFNPSEAGNTAGCWNEATEEDAPQVYMRAGGKTVQLSAPEAGVEEGGSPPVQYPAAYVGASQDGSKVFFVTRAELTKDDEGIHDFELYEYDTETGGLTRISSGESGEADANVYAVPAISEDGGAVYFAAFEKLTASAPATSGEEINVYRYDTDTGATTFVATVLTIEFSGKDFSHWFPTTGEQVSPLPFMSWYTTPDGRYLVFPTTRELKPGYSTVGSCDVLPGTAGLTNGHCEELYRYDAASGEAPVCVSCDPSGAAPLSSAGFGRSAYESLAAGPVQAMSDNGAYVFFDTADPLVSQDDNGTLDVYEWHQGKLSLISSGTDSAPSYFLGASAATVGGETIEAANVFFGTHARLLTQDTDTAGDLYDARICTASSPCVKPASGGTGRCEGDSCQNPPPAPVDATPTSFTFVGEGNLAAPAPAKPKPLTNAQKLAAALKACRKDHNRHKRTQCEARARGRYGKKKGKSASARHASSDRRAGR